MKQIRNFSVSLALLPLIVSAAGLYFVPPAETIYQGDVFPVEIRLDSNNQSINAVQADIDFPSDRLEIVSARRANSILRFWVKEPSFSNAPGIASLAGGLPTPGFQGNSGLLGIIDFKAKSAGLADLRFRDTSRALLDDGSGSEASLKLQNVSLAIGASPESYKPKLPAVPADTLPPRAFTPIISRDKSAFNGKYFVAFETSDYESGISRYEISEISDGRAGEWRPAASPYVLENQEGRITVLVKAIDGAGNEIIGKAEVVIPKKGLLLKRSIIYFVILLGLSVAVIRYIRRQKKKLFLYFFIAILSLAGLGALNKAEAEGATLSIMPASANYNVGENVIATVYLHTGGNSINAAEATLNFPSEFLRVISISKIGSIFSFWAVEPSFDNSRGVISFGGGTPASFSGSNGTVLKIIFAVQKAGEGALSFSSGRILLADGMGTDVFSGSQGAAWKFSAMAVSLPAAPEISSPTHPFSEQWYSKNTAVFTWPAGRGVTAVGALISKISDAVPSSAAPSVLEKMTVEDLNDGIWYFHVRLKNTRGWGETAHFRFQIDTVPPEPFSIQILDGEETAQTQTHVDFTAEDKLSGIARYEMKIDKADWFNPEILQREGSHYILPPQSLGEHQIVVRAFDRAENYTDATDKFVILSSPGAPAAPPAIPRIAIVLAAVILIILLVLRYRRYKHALCKNKLHKEIHKIEKEIKHLEESELQKSPIKEGKKIVRQLEHIKKEVEEIEKEME